MIDDLVFPDTDRGVFAQLFVVALLTMTLVALARRRPEVRMLAIGAGILAAGLIGVRALH